MTIKEIRNTIADAIETALPQYGVVRSAQTNEDLLAHPKGNFVVIFDGLSRTRIPTLSHREEREDIVRYRINFVSRNIVADDDALDAIDTAIDAIESVSITTSERTEPADVTSIDFREVVQDSGIWSYQINCTIKRYG